MGRSESATFNDLVPGAKRFEIPPYQRGYSWERNHVDQLWEDLRDAVEMERDHYIGTFLLMESEGGHDTVLKVIDGQQRLTTLTILLFELQRRFDEFDAGDRAERIRGEYITQYGTQVLTLGGEDEEFFRDYILQGLLSRNGKGFDSTAFADADPNSPSQKRLYTAKSALREHLEEDIPEQWEFDPVGFYDQLLRVIARLPLLEYQVDSRSEAARIFQTVNDRGKDLTSLEITKSYLMHRVALIEEDDRTIDSHIEWVQERFNEMYSSIDNIDDGLSEDRIQRYHFIASNPKWTTGREGKEYQNHLLHVKDEFKYVQDVEEIRNYTKELRNTHAYVDELANAEDKIKDEKIVAAVDRLFVRGRLGNFYPLIIVAYDAYKRNVIEREELLALFERIETFIIRTYAIAQMNADAARSKMYRRARDLYYGTRSLDPDGQPSPKKIHHILSKLDQDIRNYCDDGDLRRHLQDEEIYQKFNNPQRKADLRYLLYVYEQSLAKGESSLNRETVVDSSEHIWIEHIWPQTPNNELDEAKRELIHRHKHRLGNLALMTKEADIEMSNVSFEEKKNRYNGSNLIMLERIFGREEWTIDAIEEREERILENILSRWPVKAEE